jgi:hypothetical protein
MKNITLGKKGDKKGKENLDLDLDINQLYFKYIKSNERNIRLIGLIKESFN